MGHREAGKAFAKPGASQRSVKPVSTSSSGRSSPASSGWARNLVRLPSDAGRTYYQRIDSTGWQFARELAASVGAPADTRQP